MPFRTLKFKAGVDLEESQFYDDTQLAVSTLIRYYAGLPQKLGGWQQYSSDTLIGTCRGLFGWADILGSAYLAAGTEQRLEVLSGGSLYDITPLIATDNIAVQFSTVIGTSAVTILDATTSPSAGDWVYIPTQVAIGGLIIFGYYRIATVIDATHYTITAASNATATAGPAGAVPLYSTTNGFATVSVTLAAHGFSAVSIFNAAVSTTVATVVISGLYSVTSITNANVFVITAATPANATTTGSENGGNVRISYLLPSGYSVNTGLTGYGAGDYGGGDYGGSSAGASVAMLRQWSLDNWGQDLIASPSGGKIYYWIPPGITPALVVDASAPIYSNAVFVMPQVQILVSIGSEVGSVHQPLLIRWCNQGDFTIWNATATNQAGSYFLPSGSVIVGGMAVGLGALVWTDIGLWGMTYLSFPLVFGFNNIATGCGLIAQRAAGSVGNLVMWLGSHQFFQYNVGGGVQSLECSVWDFYWNNADQNQIGQVFCAVNGNFNEMAWHFPFATTSPYYSASTPMGYVKFNYVEKCWDYGVSSQYQRTAWMQHSPIGSPSGTDLTGLIHGHEIGNDANGAAMIGGWQTGYFQIAESGEDYMFVDLIIPDFTFSWTLNPPVVSISVEATNYPMPLTTQNPLTLGPFPVNSGLTGNTPFISLRVRARFIALSVAWSDLGSFNRLGGIRIRYAPDGRN